MKTILDLPSQLVRQLKRRAIRQGRKLNDAAVDVLRAGLAAETNAKDNKPVNVAKDTKTGLPVIQCRRTAAPRNQEITPQRIADILTEQEAGWARDTGRY